MERVIRVIKMMFGLAHIRFNCTENEMMKIVSKFYNDNKGKIEGMTFYEYEGDIENYKTNDKDFVKTVNMNGR